MASIPRLEILVNWDAHADRTSAEYHPRGFYKWKLHHEKGTRLARSSLVGPDGQPVTLDEARFPKGQFHGPFASAGGTYPRTTLAVFDTPYGPEVLHDRVDALHHELRDKQVSLNVWYTEEDKPRTALYEVHSLSESVQLPAHDDTYFNAHEGPDSCHCCATLLPLT